MRKKILFGSLLASFLMLVTPAVTAIASSAHENAIEKTYETELEKLMEGLEEFDFENIKDFNELKHEPEKLTEDINKEELISEIFEKGINCGFFDDPDGATQGGLDDLTDWMYLFMLFTFLPMEWILSHFFYPTPHTPQPDEIIELARMFIKEAFDSFDWDRDGK